MPNHYICKTLRPLFVIAAAVLLGSSIAQTPLSKPQDALASIKPEEWVSNLQPSMGSTSAPIKVVFFIDYECPTCRAADPQIRRAVLKRSDVSLTYREFPLSHHSLAKPAAVVVENARLHGTFDLAHRRLMEGQTLTENAIKDAARKAGVPTVGTSQATGQIESDHVLEQRVHLLSTPSFIVIENGKASLMNKQQLLVFLK